MPDYPSISEIREALQTTNVWEASRQTGITRQTIYEVKWGMRENLRSDNYIALAQYLFPIKEESK